MTVDMNRDFVLTIGNRENTLPCRVNRISSDGRVNIEGPSPDIRVLMNQGQTFAIRRYVGGEIVVSATVLKVEEVEVVDVVAQLPDDAAPIQNELTLLCLLDKCTFFEPVKI